VDRRDDYAAESAPRDDERAGRRVELSRDEPGNEVAESAAATTSGRTGRRAELSRDEPDNEAAESAPRDDERTGEAAVRGGVRS